MSPGFQWSILKEMTFNAMEESSCLKSFFVEIPNVHEKLKQGRKLTVYEITATIALMPRG